MCECVCVCVRVCVCVCVCYSWKPAVFPLRDHKSPFHEKILTLYFGRNSIFVVIIFFLGGGGDFPVFPISCAVKRREEDPTLTDGKPDYEEESPIGGSTDKISTTRVVLPGAILTSGVV